MFLDAGAADIRPLPVGSSWLGRSSVRGMHVYMYIVCTYLPAAVVAAGSRRQCSRRRPRGSSSGSGRLPRLVPHIELKTSNMAAALKQVNLAII